MKQLSILLLLFSLKIISQQNSVIAKLAQTEEEGFYDIVLPSEIRSFSEPSLSDLRLYDSKDNEIPYFIRQKSDAIAKDNYVEFEIIDYKQIKEAKKEKSIVIFKNPYEALNEIVIDIANSSGYKRYHLLGSNDLNAWYGLLNNEVLGQLHRSDTTQVSKTIPFPLSTYTYFKLVFNDEKSLPINVLRIGSKSRDITVREFKKIDIDSLVITELSEIKKTRIFVKFKYPQHINRVQFNIESPALYNRSAAIYKTMVRLVKHKEERYQQRLATLHLNSTYKNEFSLYNFFEDGFYIDIDNKDNPPLRIKALRFYQKPMHIVAHLAKNENYRLTTGDKTLRRPQYDLSSFNSDIPEALPQLSVINTRINAEEKPSPKASLWQKPWFMWLCIGFAASIILIASLRLIKDLKH